LLHPQAYKPRRLEKTPLYQILQTHLETFRSELESTGQSLPHFVWQEFASFLVCGILGHGFARVVCFGCRHEYLVGFSCKARGLCLSFGGRRMADLAAHLTDNVLPRVPMRQWVLSFPLALRYRLAYDRDFASLLLKRFTQEVFGWQRRQAKKKLGLNSVRDAQSGGVTSIQRFGSAANLNLHFHILIPDGVFVERNDALEFHRLAGPSAQDLETIA